MLLCHVNLFHCGFLSLCVFTYAHVTCFLRAMFDGLGHFISVVPYKNENCVLMFEIVEAWSKPEGSKKIYILLLFYLYYRISP